MIRLVVPGRPVPAVRMTQRSKFMNNQAGRYMAYKNQIGWVAKAARAKMLEGDLELSAKAYLCGGQDPDADNLLKGFADSLNGICFRDDRQIRKMTIEKVRVQSKDEERAEIVVGLYDAS